MDYCAHLRADVQQLEQEGPGQYVVLSRALVSRDFSYGGEENEAVDKVPVGARVRVLEVRVCEDLQRVRGRLKRPAGWISLLNTASGWRWAAKLALCPMGHTLQRCAAGGAGRCGACEHAYGCGCLLLHCPGCRWSRCTRCLSRPLQAWSYEVTAPVGVAALGFCHVVEAARRVRVEQVEPGSWAESVGLRPADELAAINGVSVDQVTAEELRSVLAASRPLRFTFACDGGVRLEEEDEMIPVIERSPESSGWGREARKLLRRLGPRRSMPPPSRRAARSVEARGRSVEARGLLKPLEAGAPKGKLLMSL